MSNKIQKYLTATLLVFPLLLSGCQNANNESNLSSTSEQIPTNQGSAQASLSFSFDEIDGSYTKENVTGQSHRINYVFSQENQADLFKKYNDPLLKQGVSNKSLYFDGFSTNLTINDFNAPTNKLSFSAWVAPRGFENLDRYGNETPARTHPRMTTLFNWGNMEDGEGFLFGYGRLGLWGLQMALHNETTGEDIFVGYYDPINTLPLYEWSHIAATFDGDTGYICLTFNGKVAYQAIIPELATTTIVPSYEPLLIGKYSNPVYEFGIARHNPAGLIDELEMFNVSLSPKQMNDLFMQYSDNGEVPYLPYDEVRLDTTVYEGDRYRPQYHGIPPAVWMNEPHAPIYYKGYYHVFYQHNPIGPYWCQIRWAHIVSKDMIHWIYVKDAVVPQKDACPEGVWTGGSVIGPDGVPWLTITAGTTYGGYQESSTFSHQSVCYAHPKDPNDPYLVEWEVEDVNVLVQPDDWSQGKIEEFRDPFVWYDAPYYYMMVSTSVAADHVQDKGGSTNMYRSTDMRNWEYKGFTFECDYIQYPEQGKHWECCILLPISTEDGSVTKYIFFDSPQYTVDGYVVDAYYWIGTFNKETCKFIPDDPKPRLFDHGKGIYTGQTGFTYITDEERAAGITDYEDGHTVIISLAQGKSAGTDQNKTSGWAHNLAMPVEIFLAPNLKDVIRKPVEAVETLYKDTVYSYSGAGLTASEFADQVKNIRSDMYEIKATISLNPGDVNNYNSGFYVRYNPTENAYGTERTGITFRNNEIFVNRLSSSLLTYVDKSDTWHLGNSGREFDITIYVDRSQLEVYINDIEQFTTRIYPKYGDSDYISAFDDNGGMLIKECTIKTMKGMLKDDVVPAYYENTGNLAEAL